MILVEDTVVVAGSCQLSPSVVMTWEPELPPSGPTEVGCSSLAQKGLRIEWLGVCRVQPLESRLSRGLSTEDWHPWMHWIRGEAPFAAHLAPLAWPRPG